MVIKLFGMLLTLWLSSKKKAMVGCGFLDKGNRCLQVCARL